jgi:NUMOD4 motif/HNH endonuclease
MQEQWLPVVGYEEFYQVSNKGQVRSLPRLSAVRGGGLAHRKGKTLRPSPVHGHLQVTLADRGSKRKAYIHRLVLEAFVSACPTGKECRHLNGDRCDNRLENLTWGTSSENNHDIVRHGNHYWALKTHCPHGHPLDGVYYHADGTVRQRYCKTCHRNRKPRKTLCPNGHEHDVIRHYPDGTERPWCIKCQRESLAESYARKRAKTDCPHGHPLDGVQNDKNGKPFRYCKTCRRLAAARRRAERKSKD